MEFYLDNEKCNLKIKEIDSEENIQIIINKNINEVPKNSEITFLHKDHHFKFIKGKNDKNYTLYIDSFCFDDLKAKKNHPKKKINDFPKKKTEFKSVNTNISNIKTFNIKESIYEVDIHEYEYLNELIINSD